VAITILVVINGKFGNATILSGAAAVIVGIANRARGVRVAVSRGAGNLANRRILRRRFFRPIFTEVQPPQTIGT